MKNVRFIEFSKCGDSRGQLSVIEGGKNIPFVIKRLFYMYGTDKEAVRGQHSNQKSEFIFICLSGSCTVLVKDGKGQEEIYCLNSPEKGLYLPKLIWKEMYNFSDDCVLLVLSNEYYDANEYIRNYEELKVIKSKK